MTPHVLGTCSGCGYANPTAARYCLECGSALTSPCGECGVELPAGAKFCLECGSRVGAGEQGADPEPGERRQLTVLFCDLVGSTELSTRLDPEELAETVRAYHGACVTVIEHHGGRVAQYLGDGLLVYFGYPRAHEDDAERAVRASLGIIDALTTRFGERLAVRIGIHTGPVVLQLMGSGEKRETLALGETLNLAARLQGVAAPGTAVISAATLRLVRGIFVIQELGDQRLKGIARPVEAFRVVRASGVRSRLELAAGRLTPFVGRMSELATLAEAWERVLDGAGQAVMVVGEAGVGKSRLAYQLRERMGAEPHTWLECRCSPHTAGTALHPVIELLQQGLRLRPEGAPAERLAELERALEAARLPAVTLPLFADLLSLPPGAREGLADMSPDLRRRETFDALVAWMLRLAEVQPVLLLLEDLHWCDPSSLELFRRLVEQSPTTRMLIVATARPELASPWPARSNLHTVTLGRLTKRQAREMLEHLARGRALPEPVIETVVARADGMALYVEELGHAVLEAGDAASEASIPTTLQDSLMARLDRLGAAKDVAQRAAVLGREFSYAMLAAMADLDPGTLTGGLERLVAAELLFVRGTPPESTYAFKHALVQEAAYASLLRRTRQALHARAARTLVARFPEQVEAAPELVAAHAEAGGLPDEAVRYLERAGEHAQQRSAHAEAIAHFRRAVRLLASLPAGPERDALEASLQLALGASSVAVRGYGHPETEAAYERAHRLYEAVGDRRRLAVALTGLSIAAYTSGQMQRGLTLAGEALAIADGLSDDTLRLPALVQIALPQHFQGRFADSLASCEKALALYDPARHGSVAFLVGTDQGAVARGFSAWNLWHLGRPDRALQRAREATTQTTGHPFSHCHSLVVEIVVHWLRGDASSVRRTVDEVVRLSEAMGFPFWLGWGRAYRATVLATDAATNGALDEVAQGLALAATAGQVCAPMLLACAAEVRRAAGRLAEALDTVETARAVSAQTDQHFFDAEIHRLEGELRLATRQGADTDAERLFECALDIARAQESRSLELRAATSLARLWYGRGDRAAAREVLEPAYRWFSEGFETADLVAARAVLDQLG